ncbi:Peptidoglycan-binding domain protein [metagenome]|uniref:Peptidoglycan-binding domain protein n=1 Tax=metagenome TaxID=256318 RepID=A0A2P2BXN9_9ZZZZ
MTMLRKLALIVLCSAVLASVAFGTQYAVRHWAGHSQQAGANPPATTAPTRTATPEPTPDTGQSTDPTPSAEPTPHHVLAPGSKGVQVRELQHRLYQLAWGPELTTGDYDRDTKAAVAGFQDKRGFRASGVVDQRTWDRLVKMTRTPTHDQLFNVLHPGPALLASGDSGDSVRAVQARLKQIAWLFGDVSGTYDAETVAAVRGFQAKRGIPETGEVDQRTMDRLVAMTVEPTHEQLFNIEPKPGALDARCRVGRVLCVDKTSRTLRWVIDGHVSATFEVRFGSDELPTREGSFSVLSKSPDHVSSIYGTSMPFAMFFSGGQAVHYSPDFAANGYAGASHGCVNVRDYDGIAWLFGQVNVGDKVVIYWS